MTLLGGHKSMALRTRRRALSWSSWPSRCAGCRGPAGRGRYAVPGCVAALAPVELVDDSVARETVAGEMSPHWP